jgi:hypothetical protein
VLRCEEAGHDQVEPTVFFCAFFCIIRSIVFRSCGLQTGIVESEIHRRGVFLLLFESKKMKLVTLLLTFIIGASVGIIFGYIEFTRTVVVTGSVTQFSDWLQQLIAGRWWPWPIFSGLITSLSFVILRLSRV